MKGNGKGKGKRMKEKGEWMKSVDEKGKCVVRTSSG